VARSFLAVLRRSVLADGPRGTAPPPVLCRAGPDGLTLIANCGGISLRYQDPEPQPRGEAIVPATALDGPNDVSLAMQPSGRGRRPVRTDTMPGWPVPAVDLSPPQPGLVAALAAAAATAGREATRYALHRVLLRGRTGTIVGTDSKQLYVHGGFSFPWTDDVLIPRLPVWAGRDLANCDKGAVGRASDSVVVVAGPWSMGLPVETGGRYPPYEAVIPRVGPRASRCAVDPADVTFLLKSLARTAGHSDEAAVTLDFGAGTAVVRARTNGRVVEARLAQSTVPGPPVQTAFHPRFLAHALRLGFTEVTVVRPDAPLLCRDGPRTLLWMPLGAGAVVSPDASAVRSTSAGAPASVVLPDVNPVEPHVPDRRSPVPQPQPNGHASTTERLDTGATNDGLADLIAVAEQFRATLADAAGCAGHLVGALKRQKQHSRAVEQAVPSLRRLRAFGP
jgi:hypothetical protein